MNHPHFFSVNKLDARELFNLAKFERGLTFVEFRSFILEQLERNFLERVKNADPDRFLGRQEELQDYLGSQMYVDLAELGKPKFDLGLNND